MDKVMQVSVFSENKPGRIEKITGIFADEGSTSRHRHHQHECFGIIKLLVDKYERAYEKLKESGFTVTLNEVLAIEMKDSPEGSTSVSILSKNSINIEMLMSMLSSQGQGHFCWWKSRISRRRRNPFQRRLEVFQIRRFKLA